MNIYNIVFVNFYKFRKLFNEKYNEEWASAFVSMLQLFQIYAIINCLARIGIHLPNIIFKLNWITICYSVLLYSLNQFYFYTPSKAKVIIETNRLLNIKKQRLSALCATLIIIVSVTIYFITLNKK